MKISSQVILDVIFNTAKNSKVVRENIYLPPLRFLYRKSLFIHDTSHCYQITSYREITMDLAFVIRKNKNLKVSSLQIPKMINLNHA